MRKETKKGQTPVADETCTRSFWQVDEFELLRSNWEASQATPQSKASAWSAATKHRGRSDFEDVAFSASSTDVTWQDSKSVNTPARSPGIFSCGLSAKRTSPPRGLYLATKLFPSCSGTSHCGISRVKDSPPRQMLVPDKEASAGMFRESPACFGREREEREELMHELFRLHDLNGDGVLEELELIQLNKKIAVLHHGDGVDKTEVSAQFSQLFRSKLDPSGRPVPYDVFRRYMFDTLRELDRNRMAQTMILEQFVAEAESAQRVFRSMSMYSASDEPLLRGMQLTPKCDAAWDGWRTQTACPSETSDALSAVSTVQAGACIDSNSDSDWEEGI